jgi:hypothetical protein
MYISRFDRNGNSIANKLYHLVNTGEIRLQKKFDADGSQRLDEYAQEFYQSGLNWWIIAAASGLGWWFNLTKFENDQKNIKSGVQLYIPVLEDVIALKRRGL